VKKRGEQAAASAVVPAPSLSLRLVANDGPPLSKAQRRLAQLLRRVETLRAERARKEARWEKFLKLYPERILPEERRMLERRKQIVLLLVECWRAPKGLGSLQREQLEDLLRGHLRELRASGLDVWDEALGKLSKELLADEAEAEGYDGDDEAGEAEPEPEPEPQRQGGGWRDGRGREKADAPETVRDQTRRRTLAVIYKQLAKALHPDLEQDPVKQARKQTLMQELTRANREGDLHTMLRLELDWLTEGAGEAAVGDLLKVGEDKLGVYAELLEEQVDELQVAVREVVNLPRFAAVARFMNPTGEGPDEVERILLSIRQRSAALKAFRDALAGPDGRQALRLVLAEVGAQAERRASEAGWDGAF
jgi:hypothetical protein